MSTVSSKLIVSSPSLGHCSARSLRLASSAVLLCSVARATQSIASGVSSMVVKSWSRVREVEPSGPGRTIHSPPMPATGGADTSCRKVTVRFPGSSSRRDAQVFTSPFAVAQIRSRSDRSSPASRSTWMFGAKYRGQAVASAISRYTTSGGAWTSMSLRVCCRALGMLSHPHFGGRVSSGSGGASVVAETAADVERLRGDRGSGAGDEIADQARDLFGGRVTAERDLRVEPVEHLVL